MALTIKQRDALEDILRVAKDGGRFDRIGGPLDHDVPYPTCEAEVNAFILDRTRLWRQSWIVEPLEQILGRKTQ